ncbi:hypothetical protein SISSUDRAFT_1122476 [Sistotremastrum suecicum HHB10207 ss-3]|uniref:F-box domain-containing protein n=1 Tax=Sistotremastrum suecicum HHB10207 ss-3 TaxID=1314776 RepID=A0A165ZA68_9AGAM|nr:hypothetical protein SISSUDRAFT_1122476 [Sistotremastrum suecicum HHB10207 ss-3]
MGSWDEPCLVCGIAGSGGPSSLLSKYALDKLVEALVKEVKEVLPDAKEEELATIIKDGLTASFSEHDRELEYVPKWKPKGLGDWIGFKRFIAVGYLEDPFHYPSKPLSNIRNGRNVEVRKVYGDDSGNFQIWIKPKPPVPEGEEEEFPAFDPNRPYVEEYPETNEIGEYVDTPCSVRNGTHFNLAVSEGCYHYLQAWLDWNSFPPRSEGFPNDPEPLSFAGELYEIVNSQKNGRSIESLGTLPDINYGDILATVEQWQSHYAPARNKTSKNIAYAIQSGLRGADLLPSVVKDFRCWMFMRPDVWPSPPAEEPKSHEIAGADSSADSFFSELPNELLLLIMHQLPIQTFLALASTCRKLYNLLLSPEFADRVVKEDITEGGMKWVLPVASLDGEVDRANAVAREWLAHAGRTDDSQSAEGNTASLLLAPEFPYFAFARACYQSDSMRNRERIYGQVKQFDKLWRDYRANGWPVDVFAH